MFNFKPSEDVFFKLFIEAANNSHDAAMLLNKIISDYTDVDSSLEQIVEIEAKGDSIKYQIEKTLLDTFITPFDREDIYLIAKKIDRFVNYVQTTALRLKMFHVDVIEEPAKEITATIVKMTEQFVILTNNLKDKKKSGIVKECIVNMNKLESQVDGLFREALTDLFDNPSDILKVIKWKEIYQHLEDTADSCEDIANSIQGIVTKNE